MSLRERDKKLLRGDRKTSKRDDTMFQGEDPFGKSIDSEQVATFSPLLGAVLETAQYVQDVTTNSLRFRKAKDEE